MNREIAVVAFAQTDHRRTSEELSEVELLMPVLHDVLARTGLRTADLDFVCSGSSDYLAGRAFSFTLALDGVGAWPPISESHVEMDGAWALYEAWTKLLTGDADTALVHEGTPVLVCDLWEHAYYLDYQNNRKGFLEAWFDKAANWTFAAEQLAAAKGQGEGYRYPAPVAG